MSFPSSDASCRDSAVITRLSSRPMTPRSRSLADRPKPLLRFALARYSETLPPRPHRITEYRYRSSKPRKARRGATLTPVIVSFPRRVTRARSPPSVTEGRKRPRHSGEQTFRIRLHSSRDLPWFLDPDALSCALSELARPRRSHVLRARRARPPPPLSGPVSPGSLESAWGAARW